MDVNDSNTCVRVLQVIDKCGIRGAPIHGVSRLLLTWWPAFEETDIDMSLCVLRGSDGTCTDFENAGVVVQDLSRSKMDPRTVLDLFKIIKRDHIQVLHCHGYGATTFGRIAGVLARIPVVVHEHMIDADIPSYQKFADWMLSPLTARGIAVSAAVQDFMTGPRSVPGRKMEIVYNSIPAEFCRTYTQEQKQAIAREYHIPLDGPVIGIVGRLDAVKGHTDFLVAASRISRIAPDVHYVIAGEGVLRQALEEQAGSLGISERVIFLGHCANILDIISLFDLMVISSYSEGLPLSALEAMALGKPIVATSVGGIPEIIDDGKSGILVPPGDPETLSRAIESLLFDDELKTSLGLNALQQCRERFLIRRTVEQLGDVYHELTNEA